MASYNFALAVVIALAILARECRADLISDVCAESRKPSLCTLALRSDPRSKSSVLTYMLLAEIAIDKAELQSKLVVDVAKKVENDKQKELLEGCVAALSNAYGKLEESKSLLKKVKDVLSRRDMEIKVLGAWAYSVACNDRIPTIPQPVTLKLYNDTFRDLIDIIRLIISKLL